MEKEGGGQGGRESGGEVEGGLGLSFGSRLLKVLIWA